ncbi:MAG: DUF1015 domain-containing protein [Synergistaceae bacterium]|nr:DUF1015 domain-containing protein [Synergistaceae bacterium]
MINIFTSADFLIPLRDKLPQWSVIACDQFTSQPEYWNKVRELAGDSPSVYNLILPEAMLGHSTPEMIAQINSCMLDYLSQGFLRKFNDSYIYVERTLLDGSVRRGIVGVIDLEEYDYRPGSTSRIRATEQTVPERIPARKAIRENAALELSHVILLCDDERKNLIEPLTISRHSMRKIYDFELMQGGGNIKGWLVREENARAFNTRMAAYIKRKSQELSLLFAVGDGNHSLAAAKACYEADKSNPLARYAMVELENLHDDALKFEPIHRIVKGVLPEDLIDAMNNAICTQDKNNSWPIKIYHDDKEEIIYIDKSLGASALIVLQKYLDEKNFTIDYIHGLDVLKELSHEFGCVGFEMPPFDSKAKLEFFRVISESGVLPRKTFSMGHAQEKRYYLEARRIK